MGQPVCNCFKPPASPDSNSHFGYLRGKQPQSRVVTVPEFPGSAAILAAFGAGETPALPGKSAPRCDVGRIPLQNENCWQPSHLS